MESVEECLTHKVTEAAAKAAKATMKLPKAQLAHPVEVTDETGMTPV